MIKKVFQFFLTLFWSILSYVKLTVARLNIPAFIYDTIITKGLTKYTYYFLFNKMEPRLDKYKRILDVGTGTGEALNAIVGKFPLDTQIVGIDIDKNYIKKASHLLKDHKNVKVREQNFYELEETKERYDAIIFSSSFMLMPDRNKALDVAKAMLNPGGRIFFLMTLYDKKKVLTEKIKPYLKYYTTIDFGNITYEKEFDRLLKENNLDVLHKERMRWNNNALLSLFRVFYLECQVEA